MMGQPIFRQATRDDLPAIIAMLVDDDLGRGREEASDTVPPAYETAFTALEQDSNQFMAVAELDGAVVGYMQISFIPGLSRQGAWRGQLESVRVAAHLRGQGIGREFFTWAIDLCREKGCRLVQLTTDRRRSDALRFYESLGFVNSHNGMKREL
jgi:ribosomal protein S18 acetylase RimI-like enzyme